MSDYDDEMDAAGQDHDLTTGDPAPLDQDGARRLAGLAPKPYTKLARVMLYGDTDDLF